MLKSSSLNDMINICTLAFFLLSPCYAANYKNTAPKKNYKGEGSFKPAATKPLTNNPPPKPVMPPITLEEGPYFGLAAGYDSYKIHQISNISGGTITSTYNPTINATGLIGTVIAGYGHYFQNALYLGSEIFINVSSTYQSTNASIKDSTNSIAYNSKFFVSTGYGISLLPGVKLSDSALTFLRLGYQVARLRGQETAYLNNSLNLVSNSSSWSGGFSYGIGFEEAMVENFSLRGEYIHTDYRTFTATSGTQYSTSNNQFLLALIYHLA